MTRKQRVWNDAPDHAAKASVGRSAKNTITAQHMALPRRQCRYVPVVHNTRGHPARPWPAARVVVCLSGDDDEVERRPNHLVGPGDF